MKLNPGLKTGRQGRRYETQKQQREATHRLHPRGLARSVAKAMGAGDEWRETVAKLPPKGRKYLHPERGQKSA